MPVAVVSRTGDPVVVPARLRPVRPVVAWAVVGAGFLAVMAWAVGNWLLRGDATAVAPTGPDQVPHSTKVLAWVLQAGSVAAAAVAMGYLARRARKEGRPPWDGLVAVGFASCFWQDTLINYLRPAVLFNPYLVNLGAWNAHIPGWIMPNGREMPEPLLLTGPMYLWLFMALGAVSCAIFRCARTRWPGIGKVGLLAIGILAVGLVDLALEMTLIRSGLYAYPTGVEGLTLFAGSRYQSPIYAAVLVGVMGSVVGMVRFNRDAGYSSIERGLDRVGGSARTRRAVRVLAFAGFANTVFVAASASYAFLNLYADAAPELPSYLTNNVCGSDTGAPCPGPDVPLELP